MMQLLCAAFVAAGVAHVVAVSAAENDGVPRSACGYRAGNALATVEAAGAVKVVTVRATAFDKCETGGGAAVEAADVAAAGAEKAEFVSASAGSSDRPDLTAARVVVSGGRGRRRYQTSGYVLHSLRERIAATPRGATWIFRARGDAAERTKIDGRRRSRGRAH